LRVQHRPVGDAGRMKPYNLGRRLPWVVQRFLRFQREMLCIQRLWSFRCVRS
jgi:hypothetical protein